MNSQIEIRQLLAAAGLPAWLWQLPDDTYETISLDWVTENWRAWLEARPAELVVFGEAGGKRIRERPLWITDVSDCDNLALGVMTHGQVGNALASQKYRLPRGGLAFGALFYMAEQRVQGGHAINWFIDHDRRVRFFEPGLGIEVDLNTSERSSAWFGLAA